MPECEDRDDDNHKIASAIQRKRKYGQWFPFIQLLLAAVAVLLLLPL